MESVSTGIHKERLSSDERNIMLLVSYQPSACFLQEQLYFSPPLDVCLLLTSVALNCLAFYMTATNPTHLGRNVSRLRSFRGIKQQDMARQLKMSQQNYSLIENSEQIDEEMLSRIAAIVDFPVETIKSLDNAGNQSIFNSGSITDSIFYQNNPLEKIVELYERLLESERQKVSLLEKLTKQQG